MFARGAIQARGGLGGSVLAIRDIQSIRAASETPSSYVPVALQKKSRPSFLDTLQLLESDGRVSSIRCCRSIPTVRRRS